MNNLMKDLPLLRTKKKKGISFVWVSEGKYLIFEKLKQISRIL